MKIEKISDNKIKCILNKNDLSVRNINLSDFSYGTEKANALFKEMTSVAYEKFGFQSGTTPLEIEAIPLNDEAVEITISKIEDPEELDTRFSKFTPTPDEVNDAVAKSLANEEHKLNKANEILNLLSSFKDAIAGVASNQLNPVPAIETFPNGNPVNAPAIPQQKETAPNEIMMAFSFDNIDHLITLSSVLKDKYHGASSVYQKENVFYLMISNKNHSAQDFNRICNIICEYGEQAKYHKHINLFFSEFCDVMIKDNALEELSKI